MILLRRPTDRLLRCLRPSGPRPAHVCRASRADHRDGGVQRRVIVRPDPSVIDEKPLPPDISPEMIKTLRAHKLDVWIYGPMEWYVTDPQGTRVDRETSTIQFPPIVVMTSRPWPAAGCASPSTLCDNSRTRKPGDSETQARQVYERSYPAIPVNGRRSMNVPFNFENMR